MMKYPSKFLLPACLATALSVVALGAYAADSTVIMREVQNGKIIYEIYNSAGAHTFDISDLEVDTSHIPSDDATVYHTFYNNSAEFRTALLRNGFAKLKDPSKAAEDDLATQKKAQDQKLGVWNDGQPAPPQQDNVEKIKTFVVNYAKEIVFWLLGGGFLLWFAQMLYRKFYIQRKIRLMIIGEPSAGKSAIFLRLLTPAISKTAILGLAPSVIASYKKNSKPIPMGKFEIIPTLLDIPGSKYGEVWSNSTRALDWPFRYNHVLVVVLSPYRGKSSTAHGFDIEYIYDQFGYMKLALGSVESPRMRKPKSLILLLNKFDLHSSVNPNDSTARGAVAEYQKAFADHIQHFQTVAEKSNLPASVLITSAVENWNIDTILHDIKSNLYDR